MMQPRLRALAFLGAIIVLIGALVMIWRAMPTMPAVVPPPSSQTTTPTMPAGSDLEPTQATSSQPDGKGRPTMNMPTGSTTQDLPFVDLPGRRVGHICDSGDFICISDDYRNLAVTNPLTVSGTALVYEGRISWKLVLGSGDSRELASGVVQAERAPDGVPAPFLIRSFFPDSMAAAAGQGTLILYEVSLKDGQPIHVLRVPVRLTGQTSAVTVFAATPTTGNDCEAVVPVTVRIPQTALPIEASLQRLLALRPTPDRPTDVNSIPEGTKLLSFTLKDGIASAVFTRELDQNIAGSCRVGSIRAQITRTLMQFSSVRTVEIIAEGKTSATTLQP